MLALICAAKNSAMHVKKLKKRTGQKMLNVQKYLKEFGLKKLQEEFHVEAREYPDKGIVVLNYSQIDSPRFSPVVDECRGLILKLDTWEVVSQSFERFYNWGESIPDEVRKVNPNSQRVASEKEEYRVFDISKAIIEAKLDGSLLSLSLRDGKWQVSTRSMGFAEGQTNFGMTFEEAFWDAAKKTKLIEFLLWHRVADNFTLVFELTGPYNRIVTRYEENTISLIGARSNKEDSNYRELSALELDNLAYFLKVARPKYFTVNSYEELIQLVNSFPTLDEGVVLKIENKNGSHWRVKVKNPKYLAISKLRGNGQINPHRLLDLIMMGEQSEFLSYFPEDKKYVDFVSQEYEEAKARIVAIFEEHKDIKEQKDFALAIMPKVQYSFEQGIVFNLRKRGGKAEDYLKQMGGNKISKGMNLKDKFVKKFGIQVEEEEEKS